MTLIISIFIVCVATVSTFLYTRRCMYDEFNSKYLKFKIILDRQQKLINKLERERVK